MPLHHWQLLIPMDMLTPRYEYILRLLLLGSPGLEGHSLGQDPFSSSPRLTFLLQAPHLIPGIPCL